MQCNTCKKKINMMLLDLHVCRCSNHYCNRHLHNHKCTFDYKNLFVEQNKDLFIDVKQKKLEYI